MEHLLIEPQGDVCVLKINRPTALNSLNNKLLQELSEFLNQSIKQPSFKVLIVTGQGEKSFVAGADIREMSSLSLSECEHFCTLGQNITLQLEQAPFVCIAAINGFALGGGLEMALACDFIYAARSALLGLPEVSLGLIPGFGGTQRLARAVGTRMAKELIMTGRKLTAEEALALGVVNRVCHDHCLLADTKHVASLMAKNSFHSIIKAKGVIDQGLHLRVSEALIGEKRAFLDCFACSDSQEGMRAFLEKRSPHFQGVTSC